jgi:hypothetical protein
MGETELSEDIKKNVTRRGIWLRLSFMIILSVAFSVAVFVTLAVVAFQFFASLFTGQTNDQLTRFGRNLARYLQQITVYMTFDTEEKPFPFTSWPDEPHEEAPVKEPNYMLNDKSQNTENGTKNDEASKTKMADQTLEAVVELQRVELTRLLAENNRLVTEASQLNGRIDDLLELQKREQVLRQQIQNQLEGLQERLALPSPETRRLEHRLSETESNFDILKQAMWKMVLFLEGKQA